MVSCIKQGPFIDRAAQREQDDLELRAQAPAHAGRRVSLAATVTNRKSQSAA
jgi:hypothetical protein